MAAKLGANDAAFRLGNQAVSVYLGAVAVYAPGITLYFDGAVDGDWAELGNWWLDDEHTVAATALPTAADSVVVASGAQVGSNSGSEPTVVNLTGTDIIVDIDTTITGTATFSGFSSMYGTLTGNATFNGGSALGGTVTGTATFNDSACNAGGTAGTFVPEPPPSCP